MFLGGAGLATGVASLQSTDNLRLRFIGERLAELAKPSTVALHRPTPEKWNDNAITASWLGHATVLINFYGVKIVTDPVLFSRIGAHFGLGTIGPLRRQACALRAAELPSVDLAILSHAHLDHFDTKSLAALRGSPQAVSAPNTADLFAGTGIRKVSELSWGDKTVVKTPSGEVEIEAFEVRHWGARWRTDKQRGYNGYILSRGGKKIIFGGDTAMSSTFKGIRNKGPFEMALMPIGAYDPWVNSHCNPEEALQMANDAGAKYVLPIHHYTFRLGREICTDPIDRMQKALRSEPERLALKEAGQTFVCPTA